MQSAPDRTNFCSSSHLNRSYVDRAFGVDYPVPIGSFLFEYDLRFKWIFNRGIKSINHSVPCTTLKSTRSSIGKFLIETDGKNYLNRCELDGVAPFRDRDTFSSLHSGSSDFGYFHYSEKYHKLTITVVQRDLYSSSVWLYACWTSSNLR